MAQRIILHIGTGKTGSTAVQKYFLRRRTELAKRKYHYWGLNLEHAPTKNKRNWQQPGGIGQLQEMTADKATDELNQVLEEALTEIDDDSTVIWSNESIYEMPSVYQPVIRNLLTNHNADITLVVYVRSMPGFMLSAYKQWGVKHKTNPGPIKSFREWISSSKSFLAYSDKLAKWEEAFQDVLNIYNYDALDDVVEHFVRQQHLAPEDLKPAGNGRQNTTPDDVLLAVYALHNNTSADPVLPNRITRLLSENGLTSQLPRLSNLSSIFPSQEALDEQRDFIIDETVKINRILRKHNQPDLPMTVEGINIKIPSESQITNGVLSILLELVIRQDDRIKELEGRRQQQGKG